MTRERIDLGKWGEDLALSKVRKLGYECVVRNYRCPLGEMDLIARDGETLVFVEIKTRRGRSLEYAKEAVTLRKQRQLSRVALTYMKANGFSEVRARFDVVVITLQNGDPEVEVVPNAFDLAYE